ncbi:transmembrane protein 74 [Brachyhypopomus gauderio]|uniref:transmembrane protein 74 n=1 Tax=Brachyhypopomus gauderio TaxID=698409 RepID=UPI0040412988
MAELKILYLERLSSQRENRDIERTLNHQQSYNSTGADEKAFLIEHHCEELDEHANEAPCFSAPWTAPQTIGRLRMLDEWGIDEEVHICHDKETAFASMDDIGSRPDSPQHSRETNSDHLSGGALSHLQEGSPDLSMLDEEDFAAESPEKSVDYGFISAVTFLVTGLSLVVVSYTVPRDVKVNPDGISAREMERLERENARVGAHLDRCVIAGLCLLTLGGVVLSTLLMISLYKGEMVRRQAFAYSKHSAKLYGSINFGGVGSPAAVPSHLSLDEDEIPVEISS